MQLYTLTPAEVELFNSMQGLVVCDHGIGVIGVCPTALQLSPDHVLALGGFNQERVIEVDLAALEAECQLANEKSLRMAEIDAVTAQLITSGVEVAEGKIISTSMAAHQNLQDLMLTVLAGSAQFPQGVSTIDGGEYVIKSVNDFTRIVGLVQVAKLTILNAGRQLRQQVRAAACKTVLNQITDTRI